MEIDLAALQAEIGQLTPEEVAKQLLELRTKQKVQQRTYGGGEKQKAYQKKKAEFNKLLRAKAEELGIYKQIIEEAKENADKIVAARKADDADAEETATD